MTDLGELVFAYTYVWVNDGRYRSSSPEGRAIAAAKEAALTESGLWRKVYEASAILLEPQPCEENHLEICTHLIVSFWKKP